MRGSEHACDWFQSESQAMIHIPAVLAQCSLAVQLHLAMMTPIFDLKLTATLTRC